MRIHVARGTAAAREALWRVAWRSRWLELSALVLMAIVLVSCLDRTWTTPPMLAPLNAILSAFGRSLSNHGATIALIAAQIARKTVGAARPPVSGIVAKKPSGSVTTRCQRDGNSSSGERVSNSVVAMRRPL